MADDPPTGTVGREDGGRLAVWEHGEGRDAVLLHGLTSTHRYVLMGSRLLERNGIRCISYDARGHGDSEGARGDSGYGYEDLASDLDAVFAGTCLERPIGIGISMGAHTLARAATIDPGRFAALLFVTPAFLPGMAQEQQETDHWDALAAGLESGGPEGFIEAGAVDRVDAKWRALAARATLQRMEQHVYPEAVSDALREVPRSLPFVEWGSLSDPAIPVAVIGSQDAADPGHPLKVAKQWSECIRGARLHVEAEGDSPLAWRGAALSRIALDLG